DRAGWARLGRLPAYTRGPVQERGHAAARRVRRHARNVGAKAPARAACPARRKDTLMAVRPDVVALLTDFDVGPTGPGERFVHRDGRPFTAEETDLLVSATDEDMRAAAGELAGTPE